MKIIETCPCGMTLTVEGPSDDVRAGAAAWREAHSKCAREWPRIIPGPQVALPPVPLMPMPQYPDPAFGPVWCTAKTTTNNNEGNPS